MSSRWVIWEPSYQPIFWTRHLVHLPPWRNNRHPPRLMGIELVQNIFFYFLIWSSDSSIASVVEMVSKSNATQPTMTNVSQATAMSGTNFRIQQGFGNGGHQQYGIQQQTQGSLFFSFENMSLLGNEQRPPSKTPKIENGAVFANGHHQVFPGVSLLHQYII